MQFETAKQTSDRLGVTVRAVQKWASQGRLPGAYMAGKMWYVPKELDKPLKAGEANPQIKIERWHLPLLRSSFTPGRAEYFIKNITDEDDRNIALSEYYYYTGNAEKSAQIAEKYLDSEDESLRYSANVMLTFANIFRGHIHLATFYSGVVLKDLEKGLANENAPKELKAIGMLTAYIGRELLNIPVPEVPPLEEYLHFLPQGIRIYGCYILAYKAYKQHNYERAIGICDTALAVCNSFYPIAAVYVLIIAAASYMGLKKAELARKHFMIAWETAVKDGFIKLFGIHHTLLQGLTEQCLKKDYPDDYKKIQRVIREFNDGWYRLHKPTEYDYSNSLSPVEISIALLYSRDWHAKEIASQLDLKEFTVKKYISTIFDKLGINKKDELIKYLEK